MIVAALGCGLMAGFFYAFSIVVMKSLGALPPPHGIAAMQTINIVVINPWFLVVFFGTAALCLFAIAAAVARWQESGTGYGLVASVLYLAGTVGVTMLFNVPRNNALAAASPTSSEAATLWTDYLTTWTAWNHVRMAAALAAAALFTIALYVRAWAAPA